MNRRRTLKLLISAAAGAGALLMAVLPAASPAAAAPPSRSAAALLDVSLNGSGSSWSGPALDQWRRDIESTGININFVANGSATGRTDWVNGANDFTASDVPFRSGVDQGVDQTGHGAGKGNPENPRWRFSYVPVTAGGTTFMYNLRLGGKQLTNLRLSPDVIVAIFTNQITYWDDPRVTADAGQTLPHIPITPVIRSDGSGASAQFTRWMEHTHKSEWDAYCTGINGISCGDYTEFFPTPAQQSQMRAMNGSDSVANYIMSPQGIGSIGYDEYAYAKQNNWPVVKVLNPAGYYTVPTASNVAIALSAAKIRGVDDNTPPDDPNFLQQNLDGVYTNSDPRSYPISSYSYIIVPRDVGALPPVPRFTDDHGAGLSQYVTYILCTGQGEADRLGYSPIPRNLVKGGMLQNQHIPGEQMGVDPQTLSNCPNPTFDSAGNLTVLTQAKMPSPCDKAGTPLSCTDGGGGTSGGGGGTTGGGTKGGGTSGGGSHGGTTGGGSGGGSGGGTGSTGGGTGGGTAGGAAGGAAGGPTATTTDPLTGQPVDDGSGTSDGTVLDQQAAAGIVDLPQRHDALLMSSMTALELVAAVVIPPALGSYIVRRRRMSGRGL